MKKNLFYLGTLTILLLFACGDQKKSTETQEADSSVVIQKENDLATEAKEESEAAKSDAASAEESVDELLKDI